MREFRVREGRARLPPGHRRPPDEPLRLSLSLRLRRRPPLCEVSAAFETFFCSFKSRLNLRLKVNMNLNLNRNLNRNINLKLNLNLDLYS